MVECFEGRKDRGVIQNVAIHLEKHAKTTLWRDLLNCTRKDRYWQPSEQIQIGLRRAADLERSFTILVSNCLESQVCVR
jgi:hypothetical protein